MWVPRFACPECRCDLRTLDAELVACERCHRRFDLQQGIWRFLSDVRAAKLQPFVRQYRSIRESEGRRPAESDYYRRLPYVLPADPNAQEWRVRAETFRHLVDRVIPPDASLLRVLDVGAGSGWLCHRLSELGHLPVAVDVVDDAADGLGAFRHYARQFTVVQADFDALPFAPRQFDLVLFNASLHYAPDVAVTLMCAYELLAARGVLVVMDSPMFQRDDDGAAMVGEKVRRFASTVGADADAHGGVGYITFQGLALAADRLKLPFHFIPSRGPIYWRLRRSLARLRLHRAPAAFGLWFAKRT